METRNLIKLQSSPFALLPPAVTTDLFVIRLAVLPGGCIYRFIALSATKTKEVIWLCDVFKIYLCLKTLGNGKQ